MGKNKLAKFTEMQHFDNVMQPSMKGLIETDNQLKGKWHKEIFGNENPIVLELGCGKGEYTVGLAKRYPEKNFIGVDIKGARIWRGAKTAVEEGLKNVFFLRSKIDFIDKFFAENEVSEIWIPHPDPQPKKPNKRLTSPYFIALYQKMCKDDSIINLKTDSAELYIYTLDLLNANEVETIENFDDIHSAGIKNEITEIQTFYEKMFLDEGSKITFLSFRLDKNKQFVAPKDKQLKNYKYI